MMKLERSMKWGLVGGAIVGAAIGCSSEDDPGSGSDPNGSGGDLTGSGGGDGSGGSEGSGGDGNGGQGSGGADTGGSSPGGASMGGDGGMGGRADGCDSDQQDNDGNGTCAPGCPTLNCGDFTCIDETGEALCTGGIALTVNGMPNRLDADVVITGPEGYERSLGRSQFIRVPAGTYTVTATAVDEGLGTHNPAVLVQEVIVTSLEGSAATVDYLFDCTAATVFTDATLEAAVRAELGFDGVQPVDCGDMATITELDVGTGCCDRVSPDDLVGLEQALNLTTLVVRYANVSDLSPLSELRRLRVLDLTKASVSDLSPLAGLVELRDLNLGNNFLSDLTGLASLTNLRVLELNNNTLGTEDLVHLAPLVNLRQIELDSNAAVGSIAVASNWPEIEIVDLSFTGVTDLAPLQDRSRLDTVRISQTDVEDLSPLVQNLDFDGQLTMGTSCADPVGADAVTLEARGVSIAANGTTPRDNCP